MAKVAPVTTNELSLAGMVAVPLLKIVPLFTLMGLSAITAALVRPQKGAGSAETGDPWP